MQLYSRLARGMAAACLLALAACALPPPIQAPEGSGPAFSRVGRFALHVQEADGKENAVQGSFAWRDDGSRLQLDLASPLGDTLARVDVNPDTAVLRKSNGDEIQAYDADELVSLVLGSPVPVSGLRDWLRGRTAARAKAVVSQRDEQGRPLAFVQDGWQVKAQQYDAEGPTRLQLARSQDGQDVDLRLVINTP